MRDETVARKLSSAMLHPVFLIAVAVAFKVLLLVFNSVPFNGDEGIVALMARHILQGERPTFFYGQAYLGATDAWLVAISFSIFGQSVLAIRLAQIALFTVFLITSYLVAKQIISDDWGARVAVVLLALPPAMLTLYTTATLGGYGETLLFGNVLVLIAYHVSHTPALAGSARGAEHGSLRWWLLLGIIAGFAFYTFPLVLIYVIPIGLWLLTRHRLKAWRGYGIALIGFALGSAPWWMALIQSGGALMAEMTGSAVAGSVAAPTFLQSLGVRSINFFLFGASAWLGLRHPWLGELILPSIDLLAVVSIAGTFTFIIMRGLKKLSGIRGLRVFEFSVLTLWFLIAWLYAPAIPNVIAILAPVLGIVVLVVYPAALVYAIKHGPRLLWGMIGVLLITFLLTPFGGDPSGRYFLPLYLPLALLTAMLLQRFRNENGTLVALLVAIVVGYNVSMTLIAAAKQPPGISTQFDAATWIDHTRDQELIDFLLANHETRGYTNYWVQTPIAFLSGERIISAARLPYHLDLGYTPRDDRYPPYTQAVRESPRAFYVTTNHPKLDALIREGLTKLSVNFKEHTIGNYHLFYDLSRKVEPEEVGVHETVAK